MEVASVKIFESPGLKKVIKKYSTNYFCYYFTNHLSVFVYWVYIIFVVGLQGITII